MEPSLPPKRDSCPLHSVGGKKGQKTPSFENKPFLMHRTQVLWPILSAVKFIIRSPWILVRLFNYFQANSDLTNKKELFQCSYSTQLFLCIFSLLARVFLNNGQVLFQKRVKQTLNSSPVDK